MKKEEEKGRKREIDREEEGERERKKEIDREEERGRWGEK